MSESLPAQRHPLCAASARLRTDPMAGSAPTTRRWLLIEHPGPWQFDALGGMSLPTAVHDDVVNAVRAHGARVLLIRRPGRRTSRTERLWGALDQVTGCARWGHWSEPEDLLAAAAALGSDLSSSSPAEPMLLVCTHGRHDTCCAVFGRPVAATLAQQWPEVTWECSHLGGDRFAANLLIAPDGFYYGQLDAGTAVDVVARHLRGEVDARFLRGSTGVPPVMQAALIAAHERYGPTSATAIRADGLEMVSADRWTVRLLAEPPLPARIDVVVVRTRQAPALLTCGAQAASAAMVFTAEQVLDDQSP